MARSARQRAAPVVEPDLSATLHLVTGPEDLLRDRAVERIEGAVRDQHPDVQLVRVYPERYSPGDVTARAAPSLFADHTVLVIRDLEDASEDLLVEVRRLIADMPPHIVLVLSHRGSQRGSAVLDAARAAGAAVHECPGITTDADRTAFIVAEFRRARRQVEPAAAVALLEAVGQDLRELAAACAQLIADTTGEAESPTDHPMGSTPPVRERPGARSDQVSVDVATVTRYYGGRVEATGFKVADAVITGRTDEAVVLLRLALVSGVDPVPIVAVLALGLRSLAKVADAGPGRSIDLARRLGMAPWQVDKARRQLRGWSTAGLARAIEAVATADLAVKGGLPSPYRKAGNPRHAAERAVLEIAAARHM
ncbi:MAG: DNA polymerase III subunit delta [Angustibacter sp.]